MSLSARLIHAAAVATLLLQVAAWTVGQLNAAAAQVGHAPVAEALR